MSLLLLFGGAGIPAPIPPAICYPTSATIARSLTSAAVAFTDTSASVPIPDSSATVIITP